jgi:hypothetical protein
MAVICVNTMGLDPIPMPLDGSTALTANTLVYRDTANGVVKAATAATDSLVLYGVNLDTVASGATEARVLPLVDGQTFLVDCTNNTATTQLMKNHLLTDAGTINNTATQNATKAAVFIADSIQGAAADKKLIGRFAKTGIVTA